MTEVTADLPAPVFVHSVAQRTGTNYLLDLLRLHPACETARRIHEDYFLEESDPLVVFVEAVTTRWGDYWGVTEQDRNTLLSFVGDGLVRFLLSRTERSDDGGERRGELGPPRFIVSKTPSPLHLDRFSSLFPGGRLILMVRHPRAVVESGVLSGFYGYERGMRMWRDGAQRVLLALGASSPPLLVRYEDLWPDPERELRRIFEFLGLDQSAYDFRAARDLPVRGSSVLRGQGGGLDWQPVAKDDAFNPIERGRDWPARREMRLSAICGALLESFGYDPLPAVRPGPWVVWNRAHDLGWAAGRLVYRQVVRTRFVLARSGGRR